MTLQVTELVVPSAVDESFRDLVRVRNAVEAHSLGSGMLSLTPEELLPLFRSSARRKRRHLVAHRDGVLVGRGIVTMSGGDEAVAAGLNVDVLPEHRGRGVGAALHEALERIAVESDRSVVQCTTIHTDAGGDQLVPATGFGRIGGDDSGARFLIGQGYRLEQISRVSRLDVVDAPAAPEVDGRWRLHDWFGATPDRWLEDVALLKTVMSTATPSGELTVDAQVWGTSDVRDSEAEHAAGGRGLLTCVAEHVESGRLVALTEIDIPSTDRPAVQEDTLVLPEHRGHRLGTIVKAANLRRLHEVAPEVTTVLTFNAEENRPMLAVNEALGFRAIGYEGAWERPARLGVEMTGEPAGAP